MNIQFPLCSNSPISIEIQDLGDDKSRITVSYEEQSTITFDFTSRKKRPVDSTRFSLSGKGHVTMTLTGGRGSIVINPRTGRVLSGERYITVVPQGKVKA